MTRDEAQLEVNRVNSTRKGNDRRAVLVQCFDGDQPTGWNVQIRDLGDYTATTDGDCRYVPIQPFKIPECDAF